MLAAEKLTVKSPDGSRSVTPIKLPDTTRSNIFNIVGDLGDVKLTPYLSQKSEPDLINLSSCKTSPVPTIASASSFKHILGSEFSPESTLEIPKRSISSSPITTKQLTDDMKSKLQSEKVDEVIKLEDVLKPDGQFKIEDIMDDATVTFQSEVIQSESMSEDNCPSLKSTVGSPDLLVTGTDGEHIPLHSPVLARKSSSKSEETFTSTNDDDDLNQISPKSESSEENSGDQNENLLSGISCEEFQVKYQSEVSPKTTKPETATEKPPTSCSTASQESPSQIKFEATPSPKLSEDIDKTDAKELQKDDFMGYTSISANVEETIEEPMKTKGPSVTFSPTLDDGLSETSKSMNPENKEVTLKTALKSSLKTDDQKLSVSDQ